MFATVNIGQFIGTRVEGILWLCVGTYFVWFWPQKVHRDIPSGKTSKEQGLAKLKNIKPWFGYFLIIWGLFQIVQAFSQYYG